MGQKNAMLERKATRISCRAPEAKEVFLVGTFNDWRPRATPMIREGKGEWGARLELVPGRYEFKYVVDGQWCYEPGFPDQACECEGCVPNVFGTLNRILEVVD